MKKINKAFFGDLARALVYAIIFSFVAILIFAVIVKTFGIGEKTIAAVNSGLKTLCLLLGILLGFKDNQTGLIKGLFTGVLYIVLSFLIFALLSTEGFASAKLSIFDVLLGAAVGVISGIIKVNLRQKNEV